MIRRQPPNNEVLMADRNLMNSSGSPPTILMPAAHFCSIHFPSGNHAGHERGILDQLHRRLDGDADPGNQTGCLAEPAALKLKNAIRALLFAVAEFE